MVEAVTANLACGGPHTSASIAGAQAWAKAAASEGIDLLFLQECPEDLAPILGERYSTFAYDGDRPAYRCRALLAVRRGSALQASRVALPTADYHRTYLAAARVQLGSLDPFVAVSVHASPTPFEARYRNDWPWRLAEERTVQVGQRLWDADFVLDTLLRLTKDRVGVLAAGDFNEARAFDTAGNPWAKQYFARAKNAGLRDVTHRLWEGERPTRGAFQDDHVLATANLDVRIRHAEVVSDGPLASVESDHHPLRWSIDLDPS